MREFKLSGGPTQKRFAFRTNKLTVSTEKGVGNLLKVWRESNQHERMLGLKYWGWLRTLLVTIATEEKVTITVEQMAGIFCALSPNNSERNNIDDYRAILKLGGSATVRTYGRCKQNALDILFGNKTPEEVLGRKTRSMWANIIDPEDTEQVTIDGHMVGMWRGKRLTMDEAGTNEEEYAQIRDGVKMLAAIVSNPTVTLNQDGTVRMGTANGKTFCQNPLVPSAIQAVLWITWRRLHKVQQVAAGSEEKEMSGQIRLFTD